MIRKHILVFLALLATLGSLSCSSEQTGSRDSNSGVSVDNPHSEHAIRLAIEAIRPHNKKRIYDLVPFAIQSLDPKDNQLWRITFKTKQFTQTNPKVEELPAGGEIFVTVNLATKSTEITYGE